jgi:hypothetical protein
MTELYFDFELLVNELCAALNNEWRIVKTAIKEVYTIQHYTYKVQLRLRFVLTGKNEGQIRISGLLCDELMPFNPYLEHITDGALPPCKIHVNPQRPVKAIKSAIEMRLLPKVYQTMREAHHAYLKASEAKLRILGDEETLISASSNQLMRTPQNNDLTYYDRKRGRSVNVSVQDPATVPGNVRVTLDIDADEASAILNELFYYWAELKHGASLRPKTNEYKLPRT